MNILELKEATRDYVIYLYRPDGKGSYGEIRVNINDDESVIILHANEDNSIGYYAQKAVKAVKECIKERNLPLEFTQAWH